jgi:hypothetical protein
VGLKVEAEAFAVAASLDVHQALVHIFFAQRSTKKVCMLLPVFLISFRVTSAPLSLGNLYLLAIHLTCLGSGGHLDDYKTLSGSM